MNDTVPAVLLAAPRILVIDDNRAIHDDFRKIFGAGRGRAAPSAAEQAVFGGGEFAGAAEFRVDFAHQGEEGLALVRLAQEQEQPYAMAFVDVRMPPGWDGIETTAQICRHDPDIQIVICTAYSDYSWSEMLAKLGRSDRLVILKKPFDTIEVMQLASALSEKWRLARESRTLLEDLESRVAERTRELVQTVDELRRSESVLKEADEKIRRLNRVYAVLSGINTLIVRTRDRDELFREACRIAVGVGGFKLAWVAVADRSAMRLELMASEGVAPDYLAQMPLSLSESDGNFGLAGRVVNEKSPVIVDDMEHDPRVALHRQAGERGFHSLVMLPLVVSDAVVGVLALYAGEIGFFDADEMKLLLELAGDIAFALENLGRQQKLEKLARIRAVSSQVNAAIVRIDDPEGLLREICRIAVEHGEFELTWTALIDQEKKHIQPVAWTGFTDEVAHNLRWANLSNPLVTMAEAIRTCKVAVRNDIGTESPAGSLRQDAMKRGYPSTACVPFMVDESVAAAMILFAPESEFFDAEELVLLNEMAADVSFALQAMEARKEVEYLSYYDALTGLANRSLFLERLAQYVRSATTGGHKVALFLLDLERFKNINDSLGRPAGDALLRQVAEWLTRNVGDANLVARVGADIFAVVLPEVKPDKNVAGLLEKAVAAFMEHPFRLNDAVFRIALKVGVALFPDDGADADTLFRNAEAALKKAKARGERYLFYKAKMTDSVAGKLTLENQLRRALDNEEFVLHYQPKLSLLNSKLTGAEALIRWNDPQTGLVPPGRFIPVLEETGLIYDVGRWALRKALAEHLRWRDAGLATLRIAVNVSPLQLRNRGFIAELRQALGIDKLAANGLELEITESLIMEDVKHNIASLQAIRDMGVRIAIDDFGTGFSSLSYLSKLPVHTLKIDRSFVIDMTLGPDGLSLVATIIQLAHSLKLKVVAEGVETEEQSRLLRLLNCDEMQGYLFSKPVPGEEFEARFLAPTVAVAA